MALLDRDRCPLPVTTSPDDSEFVIPLNATLAEQIVVLMSGEKRNRLLDAFVDLANALAPYVTRQTIMQQTSEARLAGRLFDADKVVSPLLGDLVDDFFEAVRDAWQWNSRYWEQRALALSGTDLTVAVQHARHAVAIERHPFPMTTLANLLFLEMERDASAATSSRFEEAFDLLSAAISWEATSGRRRTKHAFWVLLRGVRTALSRDLTLSRHQTEMVKRTCSEIEQLFPKSVNIVALSCEVGALL